MVTKLKFTDSERLAKNKGSREKHGFPGEEKLEFILRVDGGRWGQKLKGSGKEEPRGRRVCGETGIREVHLGEMWKPSAVGSSLNL